MVQLKYKSKNKDAILDKKYIITAIVSTFIVYAGVFKNDFVINWDDHLYITDYDVIKIFSWETVKTIFTTFHYENYHPLTNLSNAIEYKFFGLNPFPYHFINLVLHLFNVFLVYRFIILISGKQQVAFITALFFGIHPMHVESVAWASERKDLLYSFFYLYGLIVYTKFLNSENIRHLLYAFVFFVLSCLSKSAAITFPLLLFLLDFYFNKKNTWKTLFQKVPFFVVAIVFGVVAIASQSATGATSMVVQYGIIDKLFLSSYALVFYIVKFFVPFDLSIMHLYPVKNNGYFPLEYYAAAILVVFLSFLVICNKSMKKELITGLLFFIITISLVIQIIPVGRAIVAERYTYIPYIGLLYVSSFFYMNVMKGEISFLQKYKALIKYMGLAIIILFCFLSHNRTKVWKDGIELFSDAIEKNPNVELSYYNRGYLKQMKGDYKKAIEDFTKAIKLNPHYKMAYNNRGGAWFLLKDYQRAIDDYNKVIQCDSNTTDGYYNRGFVKQSIGDYKGAVEDYTYAIENKPEQPDVVYSNRGNVKAILKDYKGSIDDFTQSIKLNPQYAGTYFNRGNTKYTFGDLQGALEDYKKTIQLNPDYADAYYNMGIVKLDLKMNFESCPDFESAVKLGHKQGEEMLRKYCR